MSNRRLLALGKVLFSLSFLFIFSGLYLDFLEKDAFNDPVKDIIIAQGDDDKIIVSTTNDTGFEEESSSDTGNMATGNGSTEVSIPEEEVSTPNDSPAIENVVPDNSTSYTPPVVDDTPTVEISPSIEEVDDNDILRKTIEATYGIKVKYGLETDTYAAGSLGVVSISSKEIIKKGLNDLNTALALYPQGFFKEFASANLNLEVFLVQRYTTPNVTGVTDRKENDVIISIAMDYPFSESFNHEVYHYIEHFIEKKHGEFSIWNTYNPVDFVYGQEANSNYSYSKTGIPSAFFVNNYAQTNEDEDRASTFEYMTATSKASCFTSIEYPIWKKSSYMSLMIDTYFDTVNSEVVDYWERFIY